MDIEQKTQTGEEFNLNHGDVVQFETIPGRTQKVRVSIKKGSRKNPTGYDFVGRYSKNNIIVYSCKTNNINIINKIVHGEVIPKESINKKDPKYIEYNNFLNEGKI